MSATITRVADKTVPPHGTSQSTHPQIVAWCKAREGSFSYKGVPNKFLHSELLFVLTIGAVNDYAAYSGRGTAAEVKAHGDKMLEADARTLFAGQFPTDATYRS